MRKCPVWWNIKWAIYLIFTKFTLHLKMDVWLLWLRWLLLPMIMMMMMLVNTFSDSNSDPKSPNRCLITITEKPIRWIKKNLHKFEYICPRSSDGYRSPERKRGKIQKSRMNEQRHGKYDICWAIDTHLFLSMIWDMINYFWRPKGERAHAHVWTILDIISEIEKKNAHRCIRRLPGHERGENKWIKKKREQKNNHNSKQNRTRKKFIICEHRNTEKKKQRMRQPISTPNVAVCAQRMI